MTLYLDADVRDADWIKTLSWDLPTEVESFLRAIGGPEQWSHFQTLPAFEAMPHDLRVEVERHLSITLTEHLPGKHDQRTHGRSSGSGSRLADAKAAEPGITNAMRSSAGSTGGTLVGLSHRLKGEARLEEKIAKYQKERGLTRAQAEARVNDAVRYTVRFGERKYSQGVVQTREALDKAGYVRVRTRQYWAKPDHTGYVGINEVWQASNGTRFEVQFHTPASFRLKESAHPLYRDYRVAPAGPARQSALVRMRDFFAQAAIPPGVLGI